MGIGMDAGAKTRRTLYGSRLKVQYEAAEIPRSFWIYLLDSRKKGNFSRVQMLFALEIVLGKEYGHRSKWPGVIRKFDTSAEASRIPMNRAGSRYIVAELSM